MPHSRAQVSPAPHLRPAYPVAIAMVLVAVSFAGSLAYSHYLTQRIDSRAISIIEDAAPGIEHLSAARVQLLTGAVQLGAYVHAEGGERARPLQALRAAQRELRAHLSSYRRLPASSQEAALLPELDRAIDAVEAASARVLGEAQAGSLGAAEWTLQHLYRPNVVTADGDLERLQGLNETEVRASAGHILQSRSTAVAVASWLGLTSLAIAFGATLLVLRVLWARAQLIQEHTQLLADRSSELESFAGRVAHDLKNPLNVLSLTLAAARRIADPDVVRRELEGATAHVHRMGETIDGLLEFARAGARPQPGARATLGPVLDGVLATIGPLAHAEGVELAVTVDRDRVLACTEAALGAVLSNLLGNAVKYVRTPGRPASIRVRAAANGDHERIEVEDNGPGLPVEAQRQIFEPFVRLHGRSHPGIGLGLATVKKIVGSYGGRVGVISRTGAGSTFWFELPKA